MKTFYRILILMIAMGVTFGTYAQQNTNTNSPSNASMASLQAIFGTNQSVQVRAINGNKNDIQTIIVNFEDGDQEKLENLNKNAVNINAGSKFGNSGKIIGVWVLDGSNQYTGQPGIAGYGEYISNPLFATSEFQGVQSDRGSSMGFGHGAMQKCKPEYDPYRDGHKVLICKVPPGNPDNAHEIWVACPAVEAHLRTGSYLGPCDTNGGIIPVELINFEGKKTGLNTVELKWTTASERNNAAFEIEKSLNGERFDVIGRVHPFGDGNSSTMSHYNFTDDAVEYGVNYYRLKQIDRDGSVNYSNTIGIRNSGETQANVQVYPNPCLDGTCEIIVEGLAKGEPVEMRIIDARGAVVKTINTNGDGMINIRSGDLKPGLYIATINAEGVTLQHKFIVQY
jgi:hypothetical protein